MRIFGRLISLLIITAIISSCITKGTYPDDPYENINRHIYKFNNRVDQIALKPVAKAYQAVIPGVVRGGITNIYNNINLLPTIANDILQADTKYVLKDTWRLIINSSIGLGGIFDPADSFGLPHHANDLGLTFAKWGDKHSPHIMLPFIGPSTIRDGMGLLFDYTFFMPYPYLQSTIWTNALLVMRYIDLRSQWLDNERLMDDALDPYAFIRDAYLQRRQFLITGDKPDDGALYIDSIN